MSYELKKPYTEDERKNFIVTYNHNKSLRIEETDFYLFALEEDEIMGKKEVEGEFIDYPVADPDWDEKRQQKEQARIQALSMTRSDFFDGTIKAFGVDSDDLLVAIEAVLDTIQIPEIEKKVAINNYKNALNFYRKHPLFTVLSDVPIPVGQNVTIQITSEQWDKFFDETDKRNLDAYKELLPVVSTVTEPEAEEENEVKENTELEVEEQQPEEEA